MQKELAKFCNFLQSPLEGKLSFKTMAFKAFFFSHSTKQKSPLKKYCAAQNLTETLVKRANIVKDLL